MSTIMLIITCVGNAILGALIHTHGYRQGRRHEREMQELRSRLRSDRLE